MSPGSICMRLAGALNWICLLTEDSMLQKMIGIKKLFKRHKSEERISLSDVHSTRCILHVTNLSLFGVVIILIIASTLIYWLMPVTDISDLSNMIEDQESEVVPDTESLDVDSDREKVTEYESFSVIAKRNLFSHERKEWVVKAVLPKASELKTRKLAKKEVDKRILAQKRALAGKPEKIILHGIAMAGVLKKALINNPLKGVSKKKTLYVEEGEELGGYRVTSIEKDRIKLDWHGEEIVIMLYSGLNNNNNKQLLNNKKNKAGGLTKLEYNFKRVEDIKTEASYNTDKLETINTAFPDMFIKTPTHLKSTVSERSNVK